ncbi:ABC transporter permease [Luteolibacter arcticus]|uniref:ABC transporter permease n=1 Tax=Luteolibacter arcticus TaxID=1581411 RepID=A0ABT3GBM6_9BACT|nr:ABC transporter permease [Luteolibacter arcticus]MCW1921029.1 ABC transporter permease [Luteolibacter arcticus]
MRAALAILWDSFRLLRARRLFWVALGISMLVALLYASIGFNDKGMSVGFGWKQIDNEILKAGKPEAAAFYTMLFTDIIARFWLAWFAVALALLSTANIFPEFLAEGSIGLSVSKPVGRIRLFLLKYLGGLLFVAMQVGLFTLIVFLSLGLRLGEWNFTLFWAVPVVTFVFSLVYVVAVWIGVWSKSTLAALLAAGVVWGISLLGQWTESFLYKSAYLIPEVGMKVDYQTGEVTSGEKVEASPGMITAHRTAKSFASFLPKTRDCTLYLKRLIRFPERDSLLSGVTFDMLLTGQMPDPTMTGAMRRMEDRHSAWYVFGTSAAFELVFLSLAGWIFVRRDY